ncbi:hypothetical protein BBJ28_00005358 [Nothophytophthora sp. Chile5]|nr:hypothetical protein BBJ28_00005358 [Nothophytophthora sp. Chile5]
MTFWARDTLQIAHHRLLPLMEQHKSKQESEAARSDCAAAPFHFLDVGCGPGTLTFEIAYRYLNASAPTDIRITATDLSDGMLQQLNEQLKDDPSLHEFASNVTTIQMDGLTLDKVESGSVDVVGSTFGLSIFPDRTRGWASAHRVLKDDGLLMVTAWGDHSTQMGWWDALTELYNAAGGAEDDPIALPSVTAGSDRERVLKELQAAGFRNVEVYHTTHTIVINDPKSMLQASMSNPFGAKFLERLPHDQTEITLLSWLERDAAPNFFQGEQTSGAADVAGGRPRLVPFSSYIIVAQK